MTSQEFWFGNPQDYFVYQDAFAERRQREHEEADIVAWMHGHYELLAFSQVMSQVMATKKSASKRIFPDKPFSIAQKEKPKEMNMLEKFKRIKERWNSNFKAKNG